jgi:hypothetical protein
VFKLKARCANGEPLWAYRYRVAGCGSARQQVGGFSTRAEARRALQNKLARLVPGRRSATMTLGEWVEEYLDTHQGERVTVAKLRWLLGKATAELGAVRLAELSPEQVCAWRLTVPEGHRFEATQALRQVLNRAAAWKLIDENPAKRVPNPGRRCREQRPFESWDQIRLLTDLEALDQLRPSPQQQRHRYWRPSRPRDARGTAGRRGGRPVPRTREAAVGRSRRALSAHDRARLARRRALRRRLARRCTRAEHVRASGARPRTRPRLRPRRRRRLHPSPRRRHPVSPDARWRTDAISD